LLRADLHVHSMFSFDSGNSLDGIMDRCLKIGIDCVAIADHGTIAGGLKLKEMAPFKVIVAEEVLTPIGEIMGLFLTEEVPSGISVEEAITRIRAQDGLVGLPHPFDYMRGINQRCQSIESLVPDVDIIEVFNARSLPFGFSNRKAGRFAREHGLLCSAGSDAHTLREIGRAYVELPDFNGKEDFLAALAQGRIVGRRSCPLVHFLSAFQTLTAGIKKRFAR